MQNFFIYGYIIALIILNVNIFLCSVYVSSAHTGHFTKRAGATSKSTYTVGEDENKGKCICPLFIDFTLMME
jgi:hypothetical protein